MTCKFDKGDECEILYNRVCEGCRFHKTQEEFYKDSDKAMSRLLNLTKSKQADIAEKYYSGRDE